MIAWRARIVCSVSVTEDRDLLLAAGMTLVSGSPIRDTIRAAEVVPALLTQRPWRRYEARAAARMWRAASKTNQEMGRDFQAFASMVATERGRRARHPNLWLLRAIDTVP